MNSYNVRNINNKKKSGIKWWWVILFLLFVFVFGKITFWPVELDKHVVITKWDGFYEFIQNLPSLKQIWLKLRVKFGQSELDIQKISEWNYNFTGKYSQIDFLNKIAEWPKTEYERYTVLEGWSIFDIDYDLTKKWLIQEWEYMDFVTDQKYISKYQERYEFLSKAWQINTLEWFLYPDTYNIDIEWNFVDQLVYLQLENFKNKVWVTYENQINSFKKLNWYEIVSLASIIEKEEKSSANRPTIAGIFLNRLDKNMLLWADITLCYGLQQPYETCTPTVIAKSINDSSNIYNTRQVKWITPQPISNPSANSISSVLNYKDTDYFYYLHDNSGNIHYWKTLDEHNSNKQKYLK